MECEEKDERAIVNYFNGYLNCYQERDIINRSNDKEK